MNVHELTRDQLIELKQDYIQNQNDENGAGTSYGELANADEIVSDAIIFEAYDHYDFSDDDFSCSAGRRTWFDDAEMSKDAFGKFVDQWAKTHDMPQIIAWCKEADNTYVALDNRSGDCWVEEFPSKHQCMLYLADYSNEDIMGKRRYCPESKEELRELIADPKVNLGDIDTSQITDMSNLFQGIDRLDCSGVETWDTSNVKDMSNILGDCFGAYRAFDKFSSALRSPAVVSFPDVCYNVDKYREPTGKSIDLLTKSRLADEFLSTMERSGLSEKDQLEVLKEMKYQLKHKDMTK